MSKIRVLAVSPDPYGVGKFRIMDPYKYIGDHFMDEIHVDLSYNVANADENFDGYDVVVLHSFIHQLPHEENVKRIKWLKDKGIKVIVDIDDFWSVDQTHPMFHKIRVDKIPEKKVELLKLADYITTTTPIFAKTIQDRLGVKNVHVFPNAVDPDEPQFRPDPIPSDKLRFGWLGGSSHLHDLEMMSKNIGSMIYSDKLQFVLCGFDLRGVVNEVNSVTKETKQRNILPTETVWYQYEKFFTDDYKALDPDYASYLQKYVKEPYDTLTKPYIRRWTEEVSKYASNYNYFDVSLAPLRDSFFNANKSQLKIIEAGFHKKAIIASDVKPYTLDLISAYDGGKLNDKGNALLVSPNKNHKQWGQHIKFLANNPNLIKELGERLYETVKDKYSLPKVCKDRVEFIKSIINK
jgi:glycosyltransferase involved in cell wall biosynthesis